MILSENRDRLFCHPAAELTAPLEEAFAANYDHLLKEELLGELIRFVTRKIAEREGATPAGLYPIPAAGTVFESMADSRERIGAALEEEDVETFKATLRQWGQTALKLYESAREVDANRGTADVGKRTGGGQTPSDPDPAPAPAQESLLG